jgi:uncharacterized protein
VGGTAPPPTGQSERILALDILRGIGVLGILLMNILDFGLPNAYFDPTNAGGAEGVNLYTWVVSSMFVEGAFRGVFTLLFGAGVVLYTNRLERAGLGLGVADLYYRRTIWLIVFGVINAYLLLWYGDILFLYGVAGLFLFVFRNLQVRKLLLFALPLLCLQSINGILSYADFQALQAEAEEARLLQAAGKELSQDQLEAIKDFEDWLEEEKPPPKDQAEEIEAMRDSYASAFDTNAGSAWYMETEYLYSRGLWESLGMMLLGMALLKSGAFTAEWSAGRYWTMLALGWGAGLGINALEVAYQLRVDFAVHAVMSASSVTYDAGRIPLTLGHVAIVMLLVKAGVMRRSLRVLARTGQMALTNYITQSVICMFVFTGAGLALYGQFERYQLHYVVLVIWVLQLAWSWWWLERYRFGPLEWLWRSLTRWQMQPLRRAGAPCVSASESR